MAYCSKVFSKSLCQEIFLKNTRFIFVLITFLFLAAGCASQNRAVLIDDRGEIALVSMVSNMYVFWHGEDPIGPEVVGFLAPRALRTNPDIVVAAKTDELINTAEMMFRDALANSSVINLAERERVFSSQAYRNARLQRRRIYDDMAMPEGFRFVDSRDRDFLSALAVETGIQRSMFVEFDFTKSMAGGFGQSGNLRANLTMRLLVLDAQGRTVFRNSYSLWSDSTINVSGGTYSQSAMIELFESALRDIYDDFLFH